jgi:hypothetical protein
MFNLVPIVEVANPWIFGVKVGLTGLAINSVGAVIYWRGTRPQFMPAAVAWSGAVC